ncbi:hypothetical protein GL286_12160 [Paracoccus aestuariivivens]|uniref:Biosynthetic protein, Pnap_2097 family n=2 Tax=Paracoccus aestuariivivens TaxID=1820333 RepID=A0A6L6JE91_9RHOB|nr:hypothetical protein [Paracoccus aestuariivivens]
MAEMGYLGLSEPWLMRRAGDLHWRLIARAMGQREAVFHCAQGQPLYAAFCATSLRISAPEIPDLGRELTLEAHLGRLGHGRLASVQRIMIEGQAAGRIVLVSAFVGRGDPASNRSIVRRAPRALALPPEAPKLARRIADRAALVARRDLTGAAGRHIPVLPCPYADFNAAGLLYFPSFATLSERADFALGASARRRITARDVVYLGNVEPGETIRATLHHGAHVDCVLTTQDRKPLAYLRSRYLPE